MYKIEKKGMKTIHQFKEKILNRKDKMATIEFRKITLQPIEISDKSFSHVTI